MKNPTILGERRRHFMKKLSKLLLGLILSFMVIQVPLALSNAVYAVDDTTT